MKQKVLGWFRHLILKIVRFFQYLAALLEKEHLSQVYESLSPVDTADKDNYYFNALFWALKSRGEKNIRNIALTGPYGSGKSSVLKSFQKKYLGRDLHFLNISLATFKEETEKEKSLPENELLRLIEISILQQIFYHEEDKNIPDSRFKKIKSYSKPRLFFTALIVTLTVLALINFFQPDFIKSFFKDAVFSERLNNVIFYGTRIMLAIALFVGIVRSIRVLSSITINKIKLQDAEIGLGGNAAKSVLNTHLDEILYFFEVTRYNVVIIEDLDRFRQTEIFTKLREINNLLNSSKKTSKKQIVFVYAVRDDMFKDKDRTKFFDFIIPVIPVINSSNSGAKFLDKKVAHEYDLSQRFIDTISFFVDDMRLLHNIMNEFYLYKQTLEARLRNEKLLALLLYKNIYPNDFTSLSQNSGVLYNALKAKKTYLAAIISTTDAQIESIKAEIAVLEKVGINNVLDLNRLYVSAAVNQLPQFHTFFVNGSHVTAEQLIQENKFDNLVKGTLTYQKWVPVHYNQLSSVDTAIAFRFNELEKALSSKPYAVRKKEAIDLTAGKLEKLKEQLVQLELKKTETRNMKVMDLLSEGLVKIEVGDNAPDQIELVRVLLTNGYISEDYLDYISIFYEGSITRSDHKFMICVRTQNKPGYDYQLNNIDNLVSKLDIADFYTEYVLNFSLVDFLLKKGDEHRLAGVLQTLTKQGAQALDFVDKFIFEENLSGGMLLKRLVSTNEKIWSYIESHEHFTTERKLAYLQLIIVNTDLAQVKKLADASKLKSFIEKNETILTIELPREKVLEMIRVLKPDFEVIDFVNTPPEIIEVLLASERYDINVDNVMGFLSFRQRFDEDKFYRSNFAAILDSGITELIKTLTENADLYVSNVLLMLKTSNSETQTSFLHLLNNEELDEELLIDVVKQQKTEIEDISKVKRVNIRNLLLKETNVVATWKNLFFDFDPEVPETTEPGIAFVNFYENAYSLSKDELSSDYHDQYKWLISSNAIEAECYTLLLEANRWFFEDLPLKDLERQKVVALIEHEVLEFNLPTFEAIRSSYPGLINQFLIVNRESFLKDVKSVPLTEEELAELLSSHDLSVDEKNTLISEVPQALQRGGHVTPVLVSLLQANDDFKVSDALLKTILLSSDGAVSVDSKLEIFIRRHLTIDLNEISSFLELFGKPFSDLAARGRRPTIENVGQVGRLLSILKYRNYISSYKLEKDYFRVVTRGE